MSLWDEAVIYATSHYSISEMNKYQEDIFTRAAVLSQSQSNITGIARTKIFDRNSSAL